MGDRWTSPYSKQFYKQIEEEIKVLLNGKSKCIENREM